jgi:hypothetical protein
VYSDVNGIADEVNVRVGEMFSGAMQAHAADQDRKHQQPESDH